MAMYANPNNKLFLGIETSFIHNLPDKIDDLMREHASGMITSLFHPRFTCDINGISDQRKGPQTRSDMIIHSKVWNHFIVGKISTSIVSDYDSLNETIRLNSEKILFNEIQYAIHLSLNAILLPLPKSNNVINYARNISKMLNKSHYLQYWIRMPLNYPVISYSDEDDENSVSNNNHISPKSKKKVIKKNKEDDPWEAWNTIRAVNNQDSRLSLCLEITADLPNNSDIYMKKLLGEPIKSVLIPISIFLTNRKGYPTLSQKHQQLFMQLFKYNIQYYFGGKARHPDGYLRYFQYIHHLKSVYANTGLIQENVDMDAYFDVLQSPLQPLMDNLESQTYETFEKDPVKYELYEKAIQAALEDYNPVVEVKKDGSDEYILLTVVGAGRGPLVKCALRAAKNAKKKVKIYAVEKNPNAVITLRNMQITECWENVQIISSDMRNWKTEEKADIMISELLGSFGDNELSPECLDGAQSFLKSGGISIPCEYTSYIAPVMSSKLWNEVNKYESLKNFETPYVVRPLNYYLINEPKPVFHFTHPNSNPMTGSKNDRYSNKITFNYKDSSDHNNIICHGFMGFFEAVLYKDIHLSILPKTHSKDMFSWFPIYFPISKPFYVNQPNDSIVLYFWRSSDLNKVWYEWMAGTDHGDIGSLHNPNGRSFWIGL